MQDAPQDRRTYFVTSVTADRRRVFQVHASANLLLDTILDHRSKNRYALHAFVIMPDHFHALIAPAPEVSLEKAIQYIKGGFSFRLKTRLNVWERSFNQTQILTREKFDSCKKYIESNPARAGLVESSVADEFSSGHKLDIIDARPTHLD